MNADAKKMLIGLGALLLAAVAVSWFGFGAAPGQQGGEAAQPAGAFSRAVEGLPAVQEPAVVELKDGEMLDLTAAAVRGEIDGQPVRMLAYNGSIPGPLIKVRQGAEVTINFTNKTDVETTIHSHGVRLANDFDGTPDLTQEVVQVGGTFTYKVRFPDAGLYWYHPHVREDYAQELGLYGNYLVEADNPNYWSPVNKEVPLMIDDVLLEDGNIAPFDRSVADHTLMGRFGNVLLVNGRTEWALTAAQGEVVRFHMTNAASTRTFSISIPGAKMKLVGADGGKYERETFVDSVVISPSERAIVEVLFKEPGAYTLQHRTPVKTYELGTVTVGAAKAVPSYAGQFDVLRTNKDVAASMDPFRSAFAGEPDHKITLAIDMMGMSNMGGMMSSDNEGHSMHIMPDSSIMGGTMMDEGEEPIEWEDDMPMMNEMSTTQNLQWKITDQATSKSNMDIDWKFKAGDKVKVSIFNDPETAHPMQHPIHFHGQRFLVLRTNGVQNDNLVWKDTVLAGSGDTVEVLVDMSNPGAWMAHCHIAEHLEDGMMFRFDISE